MTDKDLQKLCQKWQRILRLQDWKIDVRFADSAETQQEKAKIRVFNESKLAVIRVLRPEGYDTTDEYSQAFPEFEDPEFTLIHELLHIPTDPLFNNEADKHEIIMQEQCLDFIAEALFKLSRK